MKNLILSLSALSILTACSGGGSSGSPIGNVSTPVVSVPVDLTNMTKDQLYKSQTCYPESQNRSSRRYITKTEQNSVISFTMEADLFQAAGCEASMSQIVMTRKTTLTLKDSKASTNSGFYTLTFQQVDTGFVIYIQNEIDVYNNGQVLTANGSWVLNTYKSIAGQSPYLVNGTLSNIEFKYSSGLLNLNGDLFQ